MILATCMWRVKLAVQSTPLLCITSSSLTDYGAKEKKYHHHEIYGWYDDLAWKQVFLISLAALEVSCLDR